MIDIASLIACCTGLGIDVSEAQAAQFDQYAETLVDWNGRINLTAITAPEEIVVKHFADSLCLLREYPLPKGARVIDVGTGAGFPSVPMHILRPDIKLTLLDSLNKRITFLQELSAKLGQENLCLHARAEEAGQQPAHRERYALATARAVAHLRELTEYCLPFVEVGGMFAAMKGGDVTAELQESERAIKLLGGTVEAVKSFTLPDGSARTILLIRKISQCSTKYPRPHAKMAKNPLI